MKKTKTKSVLACAVLASLLSVGTLAEAWKCSYKVDGVEKDEWDSSDPLIGTGSQLEVRNIRGTNAIIYGGKDDSVSNKTVTVLYVTYSGDIVEQIFGGYSSTGDATENKVNINQTTTLNLKYVYGGYSESGDATGNIVNMTGGIVESDLYGGYSASGNATGNIVNITGGNVNFSVTGGESVNVKASGNTVNISGGNVSYVTGGHSRDGKATGNIVNITGGTVGSVYGGDSINVEASGNIVNITGGTITNSVYAGDSNNIINGNKVIVSGGNLSNAKVYAYFKTSPSSHSNNTLQIENPVTIKEISKFDNINFVLPTDIADNATMLTLTNAVNINDVAVNVYLNGQEADSITLINNATGTGNYKVYTGTSGSTTVSDDYTISLESGKLLLKIKEVLWYTVGDVEFKFPNSAEVQSITANADVTISRGAKAGDSTAMNEYSSINAGGHNVTVDLTTSTKEMTVTGELTANVVTVSTDNTLNIGAGNLKADVTNGGTVNLGAGTLASGSTITGGTLNITGDVTANAVLFAENMNVEQEATLTISADNLQITNGLINTGTTVLNGGTLSCNITTTKQTYSDLEIEGVVLNNAEITQNGIRIKGSGTSFTTDADKIHTGQVDMLGGAVLNLTGGTIDFNITNEENTTAKIVKNATVEMSSSGRVGNLQVDGTLDMNGQTNKVTNLDITATGTLNLKNNAYETVVFENLTVAEGAKVNFDAKFTEAGDKISATNGSGKLALGSIGVKDDFVGNAGDTTTITFLTNGAANITLTGSAETVFGAYKYIFEPGTDSGTLKVTKDNGFSLHEIVANSKTGAGTVSNYSLKENYDVTENLGTLTRVDEDTPRSLVINGNNHTFDGKTTNAIGVNDGDTLGFKDVTVQGFSDNVAVNNAGTVELDGVTLKSGITGSGSTKIVGNTTLEAKVNQGIIVDTGKTLTTAADNLGGDVTNGGTVNLGAGTLASGSTITGGTLNITGDVTANASDIAGDTNTVVENKTLTFTGGTLNKAITNNGTVKLNGATLGGAYVTAGTLEFAKDMTINADNAAAVTNIVDSGVTLTVNGGTFDKKLGGSGTLKITGTLHYGTNAELVAASTQKVGDRDIPVSNVNVTIADGGVMDLKDRASTPGGCINTLAFSGGKLDLSGGYVGNLLIAKNLDASTNGGGFISFDVSDTGNDKIGVLTSVASGSNLTLDTINVKGELAGDVAPQSGVSGSIVFAQDLSGQNVLDNLTIAGNVTYNGHIVTVALAGNYLYSFWQDTTDKGKLNYYKEMGVGIRQVIEAKDYDGNYSADYGSIDTYCFTEQDGRNLKPYTDAKLNELKTQYGESDENYLNAKYANDSYGDLGTLTRVEGATFCTLTIQGNGRALGGGTYNGITINSGDTLVLKNISTVTDGANNKIATNNGTVLLSGSGTMDVKASVDGTGKLIVDGVDVVLGENYQYTTGRTALTVAELEGLKAKVDGGTATEIETKEYEFGWKLDADGSYVTTLSENTSASITQKDLEIRSGSLTANASNLHITNGIVNNGEMTFTGGTLSTSLTGAGQYINTGILTVADASKLQMTKAFKNTGTLELQGGNLGAEITDITSAAGTTIISGMVTNTGGKEIFQKNLNIASDGNFTTSADTIYSVEVVNDDGNLSLTGGKLERPVQGTGNITFVGDVTTIADNIATTGTNTVETGKKLILDGGTLTQKVQGPGNLNFTGDVTTNAENVAITGINEVATGVTLTFIGGAVGGDISGAGKVEIAGDVTSAKNISNAVIVDSDAKLTNNGGTFTGMVTNSNGATYTITSGTQSNTVVNKGTFYVQGGTVKDYTVDNQRTMNVSGGTVTSDIIVASGAVLNISGGEVQHFDNKGTVNVSNLASLKGNRLYNTDGVINLNADGTLTFGNIIDGGTLNVNANVTANIGDMTAVTTNIAENKALTLTGSGTLNTALAGRGNVAIGDGQNEQAVTADLNKLNNTGYLTVQEQGTLVTAGNNGQLDRDIKGDGTVKLSADTAFVNGKSIEGTLDGNNKNVTLVSGTDTANTIDTFTVGTLTGNINLDLDVDMSSFTSDKIETTTFSGSVVVNNINVTKEIENNPLELSKEESSKITYLTKTTGNGTTAVKNDSITVTNNYKYIFTGGDVGKLNYKVEAVDLTFKKFMEGNLSGNITTLSLTENLLNSGDGSTAITQAPATVNINLNGHELSSAESSVVTVTTGKTLNINGGNDVQNAGVVDANTDFTVAGNLAVSGNTDIKGDITNSGTATFAGTTMAEGSLSGEGTYSNSGTLTVADASNLQMTNGLSNSGTVNLGSGTVSALGAKITGDGTTNIQGKVTSDKDIANAVIITAATGELTANGGNITGTVENNNMLNVVAGALKNVVTNKGTMNVTGVASLQSDINNTNGIVNLNADGTLASGSTITGGTLNITGDVTANASDIAGDTNTVAEEKTLTFNGGTLTKNVQGAGNVAIGDGTNVQTVSADVGNFANTGNLTVSTKGILNLTAGAVNRQIDNNGTVKLNGATLGGAYVTAGTLEFSKIMQVNADYVLADVNTVDAGITLVLGSGTLNKVISGEGAITIYGEVKSVMSNLAAADTMYVEDIGTLELTAGELNRTIINRGTVKLNGATLGSNCIFGGTLEFAADTSVNADYLTADTNKIDSGVTLTVTGGALPANASIENHGTVDLVSGTYDENFVQGAKDDGTVNLKADAVYQTTAGKVFTEGDAKGKSAGTISQESGSAATLLNFVSGTLALTDEQYSLEYLVSAKNALNEFKYDATNLSQTELLMTGTLVNTGTVSLDTIAALGGDVILNDVEVTSDKANLIIGSTDTTGDYKNAVANGFGAGSLNLGTGTDKVTITNGKNLTLGGTEGGTLIKVNGEEKNVNVTVGNGTDASTFNIGNELTPAETKFKLPGTVTVKNNSEVNVKGQANITQALNMAGGEVAVAEGASLNVPEINVTDDAKMSGKIATDKLAGTSGKVIYVGNTNAAGHVSAKETKLNGGTLFLDPVWKDGVGIEGATHFAMETTTFDGAYVVGRNSVLTFGATNDDADTQFKTSGLKWGENDITAAAYVADNIDVAGGSLTVDGSLEAAPTVPVAGTVNLAANSLLMVKGDICNTNAAIDNVTDADVAESANLYITDAQQDKPYIIMTGTGIDAENLNTILPYGLVLDEENISISETGVTIQFKPDRDAGQDTVIPNIIKERDGKLKEYVTEISDRYVGNVEKVTEEINNVANLAENLGVTRGAYDVANMVGNAITNHWDDNPSGSVEPPPLTGRHSGDVWAVYIHRKENVDGLKLGGMDAKYDTQYNGVVVGADLNKGFGIALNYTSGNVNNGLGGHNDAKYYGGSIYGRKAFGNLNLFGDVTYTHGKNELVQNGVEADAKTDTISTGLTAKYLVKAGKFGNIAPFAGVRYMRIDGKDYTDSLGVNRKADKINSVVAPVGLEYAGSFRIENSDWTWKPRLAVGYLFNLGNRDNDITMRYNGAEDIFGYDFADNGAFFANAGMVFERKNFNVGLGYEFMKSKNSRGRRWNVNANVKF